MPELISGTPRTDLILSLDDSDIIEFRRRAVRMVRERSFWDRCAVPRPGEFAIETTSAIWEAGEWWRGMGILVARRHEEREDVWYIQYGPGPDDICQWADCNFVAVPEDIVAACNPRC